MNRLFLTSRMLWLRRLFIQIHLWLGLLIVLYAILIGLSGAILVWAADLRSATLPHQSFDPASIATIDAVFAHAPKPIQSISYIAPPTSAAPWWTLYYTRPNSTPRILYFDATTAQPLATHRIWVDWVADLHVYLLAGQSGFVLNCSLAILLLIVILSGLILWWPGWSHLRRALSLSLHRGFRRLYWDFHNAAGIWALALLLIWTTTAIYFLFPAPVSRILAAVSPIRSMAPPVLPTLPPSLRRIPLDELLYRYHFVTPGTLSGITPPTDASPLLTLSFDTAAPGDFSHRTHLYIDARTGQLLATWQYGNPRSLSDWALWLIYPLHFGNLWGWPIKILWSAGGVILALLALSGFLIYWNRALAPKLRRTLRQSPYKA